MHCISCDKLLTDEETFITNGEFCKKHYKEIQEDLDEWEEKYVRDSYERDQE